MKSKRNPFLLVLAAVIWGAAFVAQSKGGDAVGAFSFNCLRSFLGSAVLLPVILVLDKFKLTKGKPETKADRKNLWIGGVCCGTFLAIATNLQQVGINLGTPVGKAGFLTACYIILVPIVGLFLKKKCSVNVWIAVAITVVGLYLLCMSGKLSFQLSDGLIFLCALVFSFHILTVDHFSPIVDGVRMSCIQFFVCGVISFVPMLFLEVAPVGISAWAVPLANIDAWVSILYAGVCSSGIAYTLQIVGQQGVNPTVASLLLSLESVFAVLSGAVILRERMSARELVGCLLIFIAITLAQVPVSKFVKKKENKEKV